MRRDGADFRGKHLLQRNAPVMLFEKLRHGGHKQHCCGAHSEETHPALLYHALRNSPNDVSHDGKWRKEAALS